MASEKGVIEGGKDLVEEEGKEKGWGHRRWGGIDRDKGKVQQSGKVEEEGGKRHHAGKIVWHHYKIQEMGHILWWLWLISIHIGHSASESRRVQQRMSAARLPTLNSLIRLERRRNLTPPHDAKVNGRAGTCLPIRFNELYKRSMHSFTSCDCLAAKYAESTRVWHSRFWEILFKKKKIKAFERSTIDFEINENLAA